MTDQDQSQNEEMMTSHLIETTDEEGKTHLFEKLDEYEIEGQRYALMIYVGEQEGGSTLEQAARQLAEQLGADANGTHTNKEEAEAVVAAMSAAVQQHEHSHDHEHGEGCCGHDHGDDGYDEELVVMRVVTDEDGDEVFEAIEDDAEFESVVSAIEAMSENGELSFDVLDDEAVSNN